MYIAQRFIKIPYQEYTISLHHASIRKLTIMEWSLLRIVKDYASRRNWGNNTLEHFYEDILGMDNCEMLLKPCIKELINLEMIKIEDYTENTVVTKIKPNQIAITDKGFKSLSNGYLLGKSQETDEIVYWDSVSHAFVDHIDDFTEYDTEHTAKLILRNATKKVSFDPEGFIRAANEGELLKEKYYSSNRWIEAATCAEEKDKQRTGILYLELTKNHELKVNCPLENKELYELLVKIVSNPFGDAVQAENSVWPDDRPFPDDAIFPGKVTDEFLRVIEYSNFIVTSEPIYNALRLIGNEVFLNKWVVIWGCNSLTVDDYNSVIYLPIPSPRDNLLFINDKNDEYNCYIKHAMIGSHPLDIFFTRPQQLEIEIKTAILRSGYSAFQKYPELLAIFSLPFFSASSKRIDDAYVEGISKCSDIKKTIQFVTRIASTAKRIHIDLFSPVPALNHMRKFINCDDLDMLLTDVRYIYQYYLSQFSQENFLQFLINIAADYSGKDKITGIHNILTLAERIMPKIDKIAFSREANSRLMSLLSVEDYDVLYSTVGSERREINSVFFAYQEYIDVTNALARVHGLLPGCSFTVQHTRDELLEVTLECKDIVSLKQDINYLLDVASNATKAKTNFFKEKTLWTSIKELSHILDLFIMPNGEPAKVYIIDTCAFINTPNILDLFNESEIVRIPHTVLLELDKHKDNKLNPIHEAAAAACRSIEQHSTNAKYADLLTFEMEPKDYPELLPVGFAIYNKDRLSKDNLILSAAFRYKAFCPTIITDDTNFRNISRSQGISAIAWVAFVNERGGQAVRSSYKMGEGNSVAVPALLQDQALASKSKAETGMVTQGENRTDKETRTAWLNKPISELSNPEIGVSTKIIKGLSSCGFKTINDLMIATDFQIKQRIKASSIRSGAYEAKNAFSSFLQHRASISEGDQ